MMSPTASSSPTSLDWLDLALAALSLCLVRVSSLVSPDRWQLVNALSLTPFVVSLSLHLLALPALSERFRERRSRLLHALSHPYWRGLVAVLAIYALLCTVSYVRGYASGRLPLSVSVFNSLTIWVTVGFGLVVFGNFHSCWQARWLLRSIVTALLLFVFANFLLYLAGAQPTESVAVAALVGDQSTMAATFGFTVERLAFPLSSGFNFFGVAAAALVAAGSALLFRGESQPVDRIVGALSMVAGSAGILAADSRAAAAIAVVGVLIAVAVPQAWLRAARIASVLQPLAPLAALLLGVYLAGADPTWLPTRGNADLLTLNSRAIVWAVTAVEAASFKAIHLVGFGYEGPQTSGVIYNAGDFVGLQFDMEHVTVHNGILQHFMDTGYLGVASLLLIPFVALRGLRSGTSLTREAGSIRGAIAMLGAVMLGGVTESIPVATSPELTMVFIWTSILLAATLAPASHHDLAA